MPRFNKKPSNLVIGAICAAVGIVFNRWNVTVTGLFVPLSYSPGTQYIVPAGSYTPNLIEFGIAVGIFGYAALMMTLGVKFLPLFGNHHD